MSDIYSEDMLEKYYKMRRLKEKAKPETPRVAPKEEKAKPEARERPLRKSVPEEERLKREARYWLPLEHQIVTIRLITGEELTGKLHLNEFARYDVKLELNNGDELLIPKHSILYVKSSRKL